MIFIGSQVGKLSFDFYWVTRGDNCYLISIGSLEGIIAI